MVEKLMTDLYGLSTIPSEKTGTFSSVELIASPGAGRRIILYDVYIMADGDTKITLETTEGGSSETRDFPTGQDGNMVGRVQLNAKMDSNTSVKWSGDTAGITVNIEAVYGIVIDYPS